MSEKKEIIDGNKLIAEFMGGVLNPTGNIMHININYWLFPNGDRCNEYDAKYHTSWDWLMPVVEKIEGKEVDLAVSVVIKNNLCGIYRWKNSDYEQLISKYEAETKIAATYLAIQDFILWYNKTQQ